MKKVSELKKASRTEIFNYVAKAKGSESLKDKVYDFLKKHSKFGEKIAYSTAYYHKRNISDSIIFNDLKISKAIDYAKYQAIQGSISYSKVLIEGNSNIYWVSPVYGHRDFNKCIAFPKNETTLKAMNLINAFLAKKSIA